MNACTYFGLSRVRYSGPPFEFGHGVKLEETFAHLFSAPMVAFGRPEEGGSHPAPWRAARGGGFAHDIEAQLSVPTTSQFPCNLDPERIGALIISLLRLQHIDLGVPVLSNRPFREGADEKRDLNLTPLETGTRIVSFADSKLQEIGLEHLQWVREIWPTAAKLISKKNSPLAAAFFALDNCTIEGRTGPSLMLAWGALEDLFAPGSRSELRYRVASNIACWNEPFGPARLRLFRNARDLYDARSRIAHSTKEADETDLLSSFMILRNSVVKILIRGDFPSAQDLDQIKFGYEPDCGG